MSEERRSHPRRKIYVSCQVECGDRIASGKIIDASENGIAILLPELGDHIRGEARINIPPAHQSVDGSADPVVLKARVANIQQKTKGHRLGFRITQIEVGDTDWAQLCRQFR